MNVLRTIQARERQSWVEALFRRGGARGTDLPAYPPSFPVPFRVRRRLEGAYLYLIYRNCVYGVGQISDVVPHGGTRVGSHGQLVRRGDKIVLAGPFKRLPFRLPCRGFRRLRHTRKVLHRLSRQAALREVRRLRLEPV
jgi:hypothetical protein